MSSLKIKRPRSRLVFCFRGLMKLIPSEGDASMSMKLTRNRHSRKPNSLPLFEWADAQRRLIGRPTAGERLFRSRGYPASLARLLASKAGFPVEGD